MVTRPASRACRHASWRPSGTNPGPILSARDASPACRPTSLQPHRDRRKRRRAPLWRVDTPPCCRTHVGEAPLRQTRAYKRVCPQNSRCFTDSPMKRPKVEKRSRWTGHPPCGRTIRLFFALSRCPIEISRYTSVEEAKKSPTTNKRIRGPTRHLDNCDSETEFPMVTPTGRAQGDSTIIYIKKQQHTTTTIISSRGRSASSREGTHCG